MSATAPKPRGVTLRAVLCGLGACAVIAAGEPFGVLVVQGSPLAADFSTGAAIFLFFVMTLVLNPVARAITGTRLNRGSWPPSTS